MWSQGVLLTPGSLTKTTMVIRGLRMLLRPFVGQPRSHTRVGLRCLRMLRIDRRSGLEPPPRVHLMYPGLRVIRVHDPLGSSALSLCRHRVRLSNMSMVSMVWLRLIALCQRCRVVGGCSRWAIPRHKALPLQPIYPSLTSCSCPPRRIPCWMMMRLLHPMTRTVLCPFASSVADLHSLLVTCTPSSAMAYILCISMWR